MGSDDLVLLCSRYDATGKSKDVFIYGIARTKADVGQCFFDDKKSKWWRFKRHATIQPIMEHLSRNKIASALGKGALAETIHSLDQQAFKRLAKVLHSELGVKIGV